jgi:hypothetical protein
MNYALRHKENLKFAIVEGGEGIISKDATIYSATKFFNKNLAIIWKNELGQDWSIVEIKLSVGEEV